MCGNCRLCADTVLFRNVYFVLKLRILFGNYDLSERLLCAFVRSCGAWTVSTVLLAADIFNVLMFLVLDCFIVQVFLFCRRLFVVLFFGLLSACFVFAVGLCCGGTLFRDAGTPSPTPSKGFHPLTPFLDPIP